MQQGELDRAFVAILKCVENKYCALSRHEQVRVQKWVMKLLQSDQNEVWKRSRNNYLRLLYFFIGKQTLVAPFDKMPPTAHLPNLTDSSLLKIIDQKHQSKAHPLSIPKGDKCIINTPVETERENKEKSKEKNKEKNKEINKGNNKEKNIQEKEDQRKYNQERENKMKDSLQFKVKTVQSKEKYYKRANSLTKKIQEIFGKSNEIDKGKQQKDNALKQSNAISNRNKQSNSKKRTFRSPKRRTINLNISNKQGEKQTSEEVDFVVEERKMYKTFQFNQSPATKTENQEYFQEVLL